MAVRLLLQPFCQLSIFESNGRLHLQKAEDGNKHVLPSV
jgi:hypothetical protein